MQQMAKENLASWQQWRRNEFESGAHVLALFVVPSTFLALYKQSFW